MTDPAPATAPADQPAARPVDFGDAGTRMLGSLAYVIRFDPASMSPTDMWAACQIVSYAGFDSDVDAFVTAYLRRMDA